MALYHFSAKIITRKSGSACAAAAYRSGQKIVSAYDGCIYDYRNKRFVEDSLILLPDNAPREFAQREILWNSIDQTEKHEGARLCREIEFSLPVELPSEEQKKLALEFVRQEFVSQGMIADVCFHSPHSRQNSEKKISANPHVHVMLPLRSLDENGTWEARSYTLYLCEKNGKQALKSAQELKRDPSWEKLYSYRTPAGKSEWHTKTYVEQHAEDGYSLVNKYPKRQSMENPKTAKWNSVESLKAWRQAWAEIQNRYLEMNGIDERVDHRSYEAQGLEMIPTVHEGKAVTAMERKMQRAYEEKIARGEDAVLTHTEVRSLNLAIRDRNEEIKIIAEIRKLRDQLEQILEPVRIRINRFEVSFAEKLERLRAEMIKISHKIKEVVSVKGKADEQISSAQQYLKDLGPVRTGRIDELNKQHEELQRQLEKTHGLFSEKRKEDIQTKIATVEREISVLQENLIYAEAAEDDIERLKFMSERAGEQFDELQSTYSAKEEEYHKTEKMIPSEQKAAVASERLQLRQSIEEEVFGKSISKRLRTEAERVDQILGLTTERVGNRQITKHINGIGYD